MKFKKIIILPVLAASAVVFSSCVYKTDASNLEATPDIIPVIGEPQNDPISGYCYVTFDANGTVFTDSQGPIRAFQIRRGHTWKRIKHNANMPDEEGDCLDKTKLPTKEFQGWVTTDNKHLFDNFVFNEDNVKINAKWGDHYDPKAFVTDSWDMLIQAAEKGYDELKTKYLPSFAHLTTDAARNNFFITDINNQQEVQAKTRYVEIEGLHNPLRDDDKWPVQVIGVNHDLIDGYNDKVATLTFQFSYAVNPVIAYNPSSRERGSQNWETSTLRNYLDTTLLYQFDSELLSGLQTVSKNTDQGETKDKMSFIGEKVFLPSASEMLTKEKIGEDEEHVDEEGYFNYNENSLYDFYRYQLENTFETDRSYLLKYNPFDLDDQSKPKQINAWLRSPAYANISDQYQSFAGYVGPDEEDGRINIHEVRTDVPLAVAPCFAVGQQEVPSVTLSGTNDVDMYGVNNFASKKEGYTAIIKMKYDSGYALPDKDKISVTIDGTPVDPSDYTFESDGSSYGILTISNDVIPESSVASPTHSIDISITPIEDKFKSCSWEFLNETANKGWDALTDTFERTSFIGNEKMLTVNGVKYRVRVVQDYQPGWDGQPNESADNLVLGGKAPLTFEFITVADNSYVVYDERNSENFLESNLYNYINDWGDKLNEVIGGGVAEVYKTVNVYNPDSEWERPFDDTQFKARAFVLSQTEISGGPHEGKQYFFYNDSEGINGSRIKYLDNDQLQPVPCWTRSPDYSDSEPEKLPVDYSVYINPNSDSHTKCESMLCSNKAYVAPAFCLGRDVEDCTIKFGGSGYTINNQEPSTYEETARIGDQFTIENIKVKQNYKGEYPEITEDNVAMTTVKEGAFTDYTINKSQTTEGTYSITINHIPSSDLFISIAVESNEYISINLIDGDSTDIQFEQHVTQGTIPNTELQYSTNGGLNWSDYTYGNNIPLSAGGTKSVLFKADDSDDVPNTKFASVRINDSGNVVVDARTRLVATNSDSISLSLAGNIMSLLGDGTVVPDTIDASGAFAQMFGSTCGVVDAGGLVFPAKGVNTSNPPTEVIGAYAQMFSGDMSLVIPPAKITGFNNFSDATEVSHTYQGMFSSCQKLAYAPQTDFSVVVPYMCNNMYSVCSNLYRADSSITGVLATKYAPHCFEGMFNYCENLVYAPTIIGSVNVKAEENCCANMFSWCQKISSLVSISCSEGANSSFEQCFYNCTSLTNAILNITHLGVHTDTFKECFKCEWTWGDSWRGSLTSITMPSLQLTSIDWPAVLMFSNWLEGQDKKGVLSCTQSVANALEGLHGPDFIPETWSLRVINH